MLAVIMKALSFAAHKKELQSELHSSGLDSTSWRANAVPARKTCLEPGLLTEV
jgi:hypothetical protein